MYEVYSMQCKKLMALALLAMSLIESAHAQGIDDTIARELGLVRPAATGVKSDVFDIALNIDKQTELVFPLSLPTPRSLSF